jgi:hypothetical protein
MLTPRTCVFPSGIPVPRGWLEEPSPESTCCEAFHVVRWTPRYPLSVEHQKLPIDGVGLPHWKPSTRLRRLRGQPMRHRWLTHRNLGHDSRRLHPEPRFEAVARIADRNALYRIRFQHRVAVLANRVTNPAR